MNIAVIFAGGSGKRMGSKNIPKQFLEVHHKPIIIYTLELFERHSDIDAIVIACKEDWIDYLRDLLDKFSITKVKKIVGGGETGQMSIYNGLAAAEEYAFESQVVTEDCVVLIHDGVRPFITEKTISDNISSVKKYGNCITTGIVKETILVVDDNEMIVSVPDRTHSRVAKAPQSFKLSDILAMHRRAQSENQFDFIDSCTMANYYSEKLHLADGPYENIKITTPEDYFTMKALIEARENSKLYE
ncbi:MAG: 2-C-methyl-D-erythritol 4-phosphate cytidylyltransferase [Clostridia bacterium]|nr:2-C-methyl-D-erythritol 4-phosphate cytidylyltransferase [Clostridia bacterium]